MSAPIDPRHSVAISRAPATRELRRFGLGVGGVFLLLAAIGAHRGGVVAPLTFGVVGAALVVGGALAPARLAPVYRGWMALALAMSRVTTPLFMAVVYFVVLTPFGLVIRLAGRRPLSRRRSASTFWVDRPADARRSDLRRQF